MTTAQLSGSISHNFIVQMIPHHRAAIEMSQNILGYTENPALARIAQNIITEQTASIDSMRSIECCCSAFCNSETDLFLYQRRVDQIMNTMFSEMNAAPYTNQISADFIREMIPHHEGAIKMSKNALQYPICQELVPILEAIITSQEKGIREMRRLLQSMERC